MYNDLLGLSLFSCGGLMDMGAKLAGVQVAYGNEFDPRFAAFHAANFHHPDGTPVVSVKSLLDVTREEVLSLLKEKYGHTNYIFLSGGPSCQDYSPINTQKVDDGPGSRNWLVIDFVRAVKMFRPPIAIMEEVPRFLKHKKFFPLFNDACKGMDYEIRYKVLNSMNYQGNSIRRRAIFLFVRKDLNVLPVFPKPVPGGENMCGEFLDIDSYFSGHFEDRLRMSDEPMTTVTSSSPKDFFKNGVRRDPTVEEVMWCQSLDPATYKLPEKYSYSVARKVFGNGVPTMMAYHIYKTLIDEVLGLERTPAGIWVKKPGVGTTLNLL
jgi:site-specific DNA-cytosine methylase